MMITVMIIRPFGERGGQRVWGDGKPAERGTSPGDYDDGDGDGDLMVTIVAMMSIIRVIRQSMI